MTDTNSLVSTLASIFDVLSAVHLLHLRGHFVPIFSEGKIETVVGDMVPILQRERSTVEDQKIDVPLLLRLMTTLGKRNSLIRLDHVGFCYSVESCDREKERIQAVVDETPFHLYEEQSNDDGVWLFVGNVEKWKEPVLELIPVEKTQGPHAQYWLPHIQIDIDTTLEADAIKEIVKSIYGDAIEPYSISIDGVTYIVRNRLGAINGVNIFLDLATNKRDVRYTRQHLWKIVSDPEVS